MSTTAQRVGVGWENHAGVGRPTAPNARLSGPYRGLRIQSQSRAYAASGITVGMSTVTRPAARRRPGR